MLGNYLVVASDSPQATIHNFKEYMLDECFLGIPKKCCLMVSLHLVRHMSKNIID